MRNSNLHTVCVLLSSLFILSVSGQANAQTGNWLITQLTDNNYGDNSPQIHGSNVVWYGDDGTDFEIFLYDGNTVTQLTYNSRTDYNPQVYGSHVAWRGYTEHSSEIFFYDGNTVTQLTHDTLRDKNPQIHGSNVV
ncbi:MAG: TolB family protein [Planctomycetota bacterium]|jgi:hypothetical protein